MKKSLRFPLLLIGTMFIGIFAQSQADQFAYTVTDSVRDGVKWNFLRKINLKTGAFSNILLGLLNKNDTIPNSLLCNGVAAIALDNKNKRLYYTPMLIDRLSYVDLKTMKTHIVTNNFTGMGQKAADQSNIITRMVITNDDYGYALTNDGNHLIRFNTKNNRVKDIGSLVDAPGNNEISVHNACSSFGGDIISGDEDILYLITSRNYVFKINVETKVAKYRGTITGVPVNFSTSGAAVDYRRNRVVIGSSVDASDIYSVDFTALVARGLKAANPWHVSDLANSNSLKNKKEDREEPEMPVNANVLNDMIQLYPNPVTSNEFKIQFTNTEAGRYMVYVIDVSGQVIITRAVNAGGKNNIVDISLPALTSRGIFIVRITDKNNKAVFSEKIILQ